MNYKVLYRKYRPSNFEEIVGQEYIIKTLKNSIVNDKVSHAYIFSGPRGTGKTSTAKIFAKAINCLNPNNGSPCGECEFCKNFNENPDIIEMDAASNNGVDEIREIIDNVKLAPTNGKYKVYIIDEVHMLTTSAFNALLLTLEEPPKHIIFILATTNIENVPITILSRCQRFDFQKIEVKKIAESLKNICSLEGVEADEEALDEIASMSEGGMRDALSLLDQLSKNNEKITLEIIENQYKILSKKNVEDLLNMLEKNEVDNFLKELNEFEKRNVDYKKMIKRIIEGLSIRIKNKMIYNKNSRLSIEQLKKLILELSNVINKININVNPFTIVSVIFLEYFNNNSDMINELNTKEIKEEKIITTDISTNDINIRVNNCFVNAQKKYLDEFKNDISHIIESNIINGKIKSVLLDSEVVVASDEYIIFACQNEHAAVSANEKINEIEDMLVKKLKKKVYIAFISVDNWQTIKDEYIKNKKNGKKYEYINIKNNKKDDIIVSDVFDISKIEIV